MPIRAGRGRVRRSQGERGAPPPGSGTGGGARDPETSHGLLGEGVARVRIFSFVAAQKADFPVRTLCRVCKVSASGFYAYAARLAPGRAGRGGPGGTPGTSRGCTGSRRRYGSPRVTAQLAREGIAVNHKAVEREMARQGLAGRCSRRKIRTTRRDPGQVPAADLVHRDFTRPRLTSCGSATRPTSGPTRAGVTSRPSWMPVRGGCSAGRSPTTCARSSVSMRFSPRSRPGGRRNLAAGIVFHTDHGTQYTAGEFRRHAVRCGSPSRWEPSVIPTTTRWPSRSSPASSAKSSTASTSPPRCERSKVFGWLNWYNASRLHSSLDYRPPIEYEEQLTKQSLVA